MKDREIGDLLERAESDINSRKRPQKKMEGNQQVSIFFNLKTCVFEHIKIQKDVYF